MLAQFDLINGFAVGFTFIDWGEPEDEDRSYRHTTNIFLGIIAITIYHLRHDQE